MLITLTNRNLTDAVLRYTFCAGILKLFVSAPAHNAYGSVPILISNAAPIPVILGDGTFVSDLFDSGPIPFQAIDTDTLQATFQIRSGFLQAIVPIDFPNDGSPIECRIDTSLVTIPAGRYTFNLATQRGNELSNFDGALVGLTALSLAPDVNGDGPIDSATDLYGEIQTADYLSIDGLDVIFNQTTQIEAIGGTEDTNIVLSLIQNPALAG